MNDMTNELKNAVLKSFADDTHLFIFHKAKDALLKIANAELKSLENWLLANKLSLSIGTGKETKFLSFTTS